MKKNRLLISLLTIPVWLMSQQLELIQSPDGIDYTSRIEFANTVLFKYKNSTNKYQLAKLAGTSLGIIANPDNGTGYSDKYAICNNNLVIRYTSVSGSIKLAKYDNIKISLISSASSGNVATYFFKNIGDYVYGAFEKSAGGIYLFKADTARLNVFAKPFGGKSVISPDIVELNGCSYFLYTDTINKVRLAKYNGDSISLVPNQDGGSFYYTTPIIKYKDALYLEYYIGSVMNGGQLAKFDGNNITLLTNPADGIAELVPSTSNESYTIFNDALYFVYSEKAGTITLAKYDGSALTIIKRPDAGGYILGNFFIAYNGSLYTDYNDGTNKVQIVKVDNDQLKFVTSTMETSTSYHYELSADRPVVYNNKLYYRYKTSSGKFKLASYDGTNVLYVNNPDSGIGNIGNNILSNNLLYFNYSNQSSKYQLAKFDGTSISLIANPDTGKGTYGNFFNFNNTVFLQYWNKDLKYQLARLSFSSPVTQASDITISDVTSSGAVIKYKKGGGGARIILVSQTNSGKSYSPKDTNTYLGNCQFGKGNSLAGDNSTTWYCVYNGIDSSVTINGLNQNSTYRVIAFEYNGYAGAELYANVSGYNNPVNFTTAVSALTSINEYKLEIYPNPATDFIYFKIEELPPYDIKVFNTTGQLKLETISYEKLLDVQSLSKGAYIIKINNNISKILINR